MWNMKNKKIQFIFTSFCGLLATSRQIRKETRPEACILYSGKKFLNIIIVIEVQKVNALHFIGLVCHYVTENEWDTSQLKGRYLLYNILITSILYFTLMISGKYHCKHYCIVLYCKYCTVCTSTRSHLSGSK